MNKPILLWSVVAILIVMSGFSNVGTSNQLSASLPLCNSVVDKAPGGVFIVEITFKNTGTTDGTWSVNIAFEGESWSWVGTPQELTLGPYERKALTWNGSVPKNAAVDSMARLIVYYDASCASLNWWIHVVPTAELSITSSTVR